MKHWQDRPHELNAIDAYVQYSDKEDVENAGKEGRFTHLESISLFDIDYYSVIAGRMTRVSSMKGCQFLVWFYPKAAASDEWKKDWHREVRSAISGHFTYHSAVQL